MKKNEKQIYSFCKTFKSGFTLAETLITLTILGVVAAITVPSLINKQMDSANRTKVKKAMAVYEKALNQMIIDNDTKGDVSTLNGNTCATTRPYFKTIENGDNNCRFKTADRIWWDITDIQNPIISLKDEIKTSNANTMKTNAESLETDKTSFVMAGYLDTNGILRINDKGVASENNAKYLGKLYGFINPNSSSEPSDDTPFWQTDDWKNVTHYIEETNCEGGVHWNGTDKNCYVLESDVDMTHSMLIWDEEGNATYNISCNRDYTICKDDVLFLYLNSGSDENPTCYEKAPNEPGNMHQSAVLDRTPITCPTD